MLDQSEGCKEEVHLIESADRNLKLHNSDMLMNLDQKLEHLPKMEERPS